MAALTAFEAAARHESFTLAARELSQTESNISRQIGILEEHLDVPLFVRVKQRVVLTKAGRLYGEQVRASLRALERDTLSVAAHGGGQGSLELAVMPTFATEWLIPRLPGFYALHPELRVNMGVRNSPFQFEEEHFEAAIHHGKPVWPRATSEHLFGERMIPIARQDLVADSIRAPADVLRYPLLYQTMRPYSWRLWLEAAGLPEAMPGHTTGFELHSMLVRAAQAGLGIALVPEFFVSREAWSRGLVQVHSLSIQTEDAYHLVYPNDLRHSRPMELFRAWLLSEACTFRVTGTVGVTPCPST
ncbi:DNA-binding transcriptional LysR family regulator [Pseudorhodoferax soli]|uniref:DNA-binding transcriptional LysR family regulator n=2 Tax=Pseudorhodoferax soli TaxID=545864 RepID=A0A368XLC2_9BURK|nr:LysR substrate-binding domain-containing protein [Pseudorhodoferax soli]RCW68655.1 DNA-binding transcriptional LysR family regulator [Pseudorhodoferax soli]